MGSRARRLDDERVFGGSQCTLRITCRRFDSGSFIELTVITRPRLVSARGNGLTCRIASVPEAPTATDLLVDLETSVALPPWFW